MFEFFLGEVYLLFDGASVDLDFHDVSFKLTQVELVELGGTDNTNRAAVLLNAGYVSLDGSWIFFFELVAVGVVLEGSSLCFIPVSVETTLDVLV